jgi:ATP-dependent RNA helicase DeaD
VTDFRDLGLSELTLQSLTEMGFEEPTPVQASAIPSLLANRDIIAQALTGTGKTAAFGVPIAERVDPKERRPQAIVLTPTRELAIQVTDHLCKIGRHRALSVLPIYGGQPIGRQLHMLNRGVQVIVATPGRLLDHLRRGTVDLSAIRMLILDEADQMLEMGFIDDVQTILDQIPEERVTALFSATMPKPIVDLAQRYLREPEMIRLSKPQKLTVPEIEQVYYLVPFVRKMDALCRVLDAKQPDRAIVFCATKRMVDEAVEGLTARGYRAEALHGDISQAMRERVLRAFRSGKTEVLVATDVAARGLDVPEVTHVINFDIPPDPEYYVHRIGRTARQGRRGEAITFVNPREMRILKIIERVTGAHIRREEVPTAADVEEREIEILEELLLASLVKGDWGRYRPVVEELLEDHDAVDVAAAALSLVASGTGGVRRGRARTATPASVVAPPAPAGPSAGPERPPRPVGDDRRPGRSARERPAANNGRVVDTGERPARPGQPPRDRRPERQPADALTVDEATPARDRKRAGKAATGARAGEERRPNAAGGPKPRRVFLKTGKAGTRRAPTGPARGRTGPKRPRK